MRYLVIGDATLDVTVAPSRPPRPAGDVAAVIRLGPGGQGANVAVRLARRGANVTLATPLAGDAAGRLLREALELEGVALADLPANRSSMVVAILDAEGERTMLSDRQSLPAEAASTAVAVADWTHLSAYTLLDDREGDHLASIAGGRPAVARLSIAGGSIPPEPALVARFRDRLRTARPDVVVVSRDEAAALTGEAASPARQAATELAELAPVVVVTAGAQGSVARSGASAVEVPAATVPGPPIDATGSGDAYVAALILGLAGADWPPDVPALREAMTQASEAGTLATRVLGAQGPVAGERSRGGR